MVKTYCFATNRPGVITMVGTSDLEYIKRLDGFVLNEKKSEAIDIKGRLVVTLKKSLSNLNEATEAADVVENPDNKIGIGKK